MILPARQNACGFCLLGQGALLFRLHCHVCPLAQISLGRRASVQNSGNIVQAEDARALCVGRNTSAFGPCGVWGLDNQGVP
eukprot:2168988-Karenia_brevis.AAC.1